MQKYTYRFIGHSGLVSAKVDGEEIEVENGSVFYLASEVDARLAADAKRIAELERENTALRNLAENLRPGPISEAFFGK